MGSAVVALEDRRGWLLTNPDRYVLAIGAILGDSDEQSQAWSEAIRELHREAAVLGVPQFGGLGVNVIFLVDGDFCTLNFSGARTGTYRKNIGVLEVQAAIEKQPVPHDRRSHLVSLVLAAIDQAEAFVIRRKIASSLPELRAIGEALAPPGN